MTALQVASWGPMVDIPQSSVEDFDVSQELKNLPETLGALCTMRELTLSCCNGT